MPGRSSANSSRRHMPVEPALQMLAAERRDDQVIVTNQMSARLWLRMSDHPLDFNYNPSTMSGAVPFGLGLALAQPNRDVIVLSGEGSLLMSLGCLVTVVDSGAANITIVLLDNGMYEVTGGQKTPASGSSVDFAGLARAAGFPTVAHYRELDDWRDHAAELLAGRGPRLVWLEVGPAPDGVLTELGRPVAEQLQRLRSALAGPTDVCPKR